MGKLLLKTEGVFKEVGSTITGATQAYVDAKIAQTITNGNIATAPSEDVVFDALALKADIASPTFTGTVGGITKGMVGLGNVDNTADSAKPISTATQTALDLKTDEASAILASRVFG